LSKPKKAFLLQGHGDVGAVHRDTQRLAEQEINIVGVDALSAGEGRYGMTLWVKEKDRNRAAKALRAMHDLGEAPQHR